MLAICSGRVASRGVVHVLMLPVSMTMFAAMTVAWVIVSLRVELEMDEWLLCEIAFVVAL